VSRGLIAELREMRAALADLNRRVRGMVVHGTVRAVEGDRVRLTLDAGPGGDVVSPAVRWQEMAGHSGGGTTTWMPPAIGERMMLVSPSGEIGSHSIAMRGCYTAADGKPADEAGMYFKVGDTVFAATASPSRPRPSRSRRRRSRSRARAASRSTARHTSPGRT
jgi:hypothetical protein